MSNPFRGSYKRELKCRKRHITEDYVNANLIVLGHSRNMQKALDQYF